MFAHQVVNLSGPAGVVWHEVPEPDPGDGVVIDVVAAGVSFADLLQTRGQYQMKLPLPFTPGMDAAGVVRSAPRDAAAEPGQRVAVLMPHGCWQEVLTADPGQVLPLPDGMSFEAGAAAPLNYLTALLALARRGRAVPGETLVVHGGAGGLGVAALQVGRALGLRTIAVTEGRLLVLGFTAGQIPTVKVNRLLLGNIGVLGVGSRELFERAPSMVHDLWSWLREWWATRALPDPPVEVYPLTDARWALQAIADRQIKGKAVLSRAAGPQHRSVAEFDTTAVGR